MKLLALLLVCAGPAIFARAQDVASDPKTQLKSLTERYEAERQRFYQSLHDAPDDATRMKLYQSPPWRPFLPEFQTLAQKARGTDVGVEAQCWVMQVAGQLDDTALIRETLDTLTRDSLRSPAIAQAAVLAGQMSWTLGTETSENFLRKVLAESPDEHVKGTASFFLASLLLEPQESTGGGISAAFPADELAAREKEAHDLLEQLVPLAPRLAAPNGFPKGYYEKRVAGMLFELDHLKVGMTVPEVEAVDENGTKFKLSDYRGKVVAVDFWGFW